MYVYMYVCDKNFVNFLKIGAYNFNFKYQSNGEGHLLIDISSGVMPKNWADDVISSGVMPKNWADDVIIWDNSAGSKNSMGQVHHTVILRLNAQAHGPGLISGF